MKELLKKNKQTQYYLQGKNMLHDPEYVRVGALSENEKKKTPLRTDIINHAISILDRDTNYLEIGVRNPNHNFNKINSKNKYSVDPGVEFKENPVDFKMTSDDFFNSLREGKVLDKNILFDVVFIDGLHLAFQVDRDIKNALEFLKDDGFIILHDCNPPSEWHARENYGYSYTPARGFFNGTTWKAFVKWRQEPSLQSCCIDSDWGVGVISKKHAIGKPNLDKIDPFYDYQFFDKNRKKLLNLIAFEDFKKCLK